MTMTWIRRILLASLAIAVLLEIGVRAVGVADVPLYGHDSKLGYWLLPDQHGTFLNKNDWYVNDVGMPIERDFTPAQHRNLMVIGNSVVMGGNPYPQKDKIAPLMQEKLGDTFAVWPVAVGGWSNVNESEYLHQHPDVANHTDFFVWEVMGGAFSDLSRWRGEYIFPDHRPGSALFYALQRYVFPKLFEIQTNELPPDGAINPAYFDQFSRQVSVLVKSTQLIRPGILFLYPTQSQLESARAGKEWLPEHALVQQLAKQYNLSMVDLAQDPRWTADCYRDGVHPTVQANHLLAEILSAAISKNYAPADVVATTK